jgi:hypothetical protein
MPLKRDLLDKLVREILLIRDDMKCQVCGKQYKDGDNLQGLHVSHFKGRANKSVRYDLLNVDLMCFHCHQYLGSNPDVFVDWKRTQMGAWEYDKLVLRAAQVLPMTKYNRAQIEKKLKETLEHYKEMEKVK